MGAKKKSRARAKSGAKRIRSATKKLGAKKWRVGAAGAAAASGASVPGKCSSSPPKKIGTGILYQESCRSFAKNTNTAAGRRKSNIEFVLREASRHSSRYMQHLLDAGMHPKPPVYVDIGDGCLMCKEDVEDFLKWLRAVAAMQEEEHHMADGRIRRVKQRDTTTVLGTVIASWPEAPDVAVDNPVVQDWLMRTIEFARDRYGDKLVAAIVHLDEGKFHVHLWFHNDGKNVKPMLAAPKAVAKWKAAGGVKGGGDAAASGNIALLNEFQEVVGKHVGLNRRGPNPEAANETWRQRRRREAKEDREAAAKEREAVRKKAQQVTQIAHENENFNRRREAEVREKAKAADDALAKAALKNQAAEAALKVGEGFMSKAQAARRQMLEIVLDSKSKGHVTSREAEEMARTIGVSPQLLAAAEAARHAGKAIVI